MPKSPRPAQDFYTRPGSAALVETIERYWHKRGFVGVSVQRYQDPNFPKDWFVRSNLVNGLPLKR